MLLVEVPENVTENLLPANEKKALLNPHLSNFENMIRTGTLYATLSSTHFVEAQKLVMEGGRRWMGEQDGTPLQLRENDIEGRLIQTSGVDAVVYRQDLWWDKKAQLALRRLGNLDVPLCVGKLALEKQDLQEVSARDISRIFTAEQLEQALALARGQDSSTRCLVLKDALEV